MHLLQLVHNGLFMHGIGGGRQPRDASEKAVPGVYKVGATALHWHVCVVCVVCTCSAPGASPAACWRSSSSFSRAMRVVRSMSASSTTCRTDSSLDRTCRRERRGGATGKGNEKEREAGMATRRGGNQGRRSEEKEGSRATADLLLDVEDAVVAGKALDVERGHVLQQRGLAHAVDADQAVTPPVHQPQVRILQQNLATERHGEVVDVDVAFAAGTGEVRQRHRRDLVLLLLVLLPPGELVFELFQPPFLFFRRFAFVLGGHRVDRLELLVPRLADLVEPPQRVQRRLLGLGDLRLGQVREDDGLLQQLGAVVAGRAAAGLRAAGATRGAAEAAQLHQALAQLAAQRLGRGCVRRQAVTFDERGQRLGDRGLVHRGPARRVHDQALEVILRIPVFCQARKLLQQCFRDERLVHVAQNHCGALTCSFGRSKKPEARGSSQQWWCLWCEWLGLIGCWLLLVSGVTGVWCCVRRAFLAVSLAAPTLHHTTNR